MAAVMQHEADHGNNGSNDDCDSDSHVNDCDSGVITAVTIMLPILTMMRIRPMSIYGR